MGAPATAWKEGSSPLTRGAPVGWRFTKKPEGLIPAYAGSTITEMTLAYIFRAHPRLRGEHFRFGSLTGRGGGSSPLTRGAQNTRPNAQTMMWLIPAYAGSTAIRIGSISTARAHPRLRGEHVAAGASPFLSQGSSPLTRGALCLCNRLVSIRGLIPAYAGSTTWNLRCWIQWWAHPRLRGEHWPIFHCRKLACGSSPLTRGARGHAAVGSRAWGLIPAYAGSTANYRR